MFEDGSPTQSKPEILKAPRVQQRVQTRLKVRYDCGQLVLMLDGVGPEVEFCRSDVYGIVSQGLVGH